VVHQLAMQVVAEDRLTGVLVVLVELEPTAAEIVMQVAMVYQVFEAAVVEEAVTGILQATVEQVS